MIPCCRQHTSRLSLSRTAKVSNSLSNESKLVFRSQHNNVQIIVSLSALWPVFLVAVGVRVLKAMQTSSGQKVMDGNVAFVTCLTMKGRKLVE